VERSDHELAYAVVERGVHRDHCGALDFERYTDVIDYRASKVSASSREGDWVLELGVGA
jgi:hypothetical protein